MKKHISTASGNLSVVGEACLGSSEKLVKENTLYKGYRAVFYFEDMHKSACQIRKTQEEAESDIRKIFIENERDNYFKQFLYAEVEKIFYPG